jgi:hypothetical protein
MRRGEILPQSVNGICNDVMKQFQPPPAATGASTAGETKAQREKFLVSLCLVV